ncbi:hypothetical protein C0991_009517 [Blastosporella zonata]|nr:hypothetical protein C0991_009517 [Blastosporella zonata]
MSTTPMSTPTPPFSVLEFGNLVALALDTDLSADRFTESFLQFDPELSVRQPTTTTAASLSPTLPCTDLKNLRTIWRRKTNISVSPSSSRSSSSTMQSSWNDAQPSRPRIILDKIKHKASTLVSKPKPRLHALQTNKPTLSAASSRHSFFDDDQFAPYVSLAVQYERASPSPRKSSVGIFSRPASLVTTPPTPPSPTKSGSSKSICSFSTTASSSAPATPTHDEVFGPGRPSISSPSPDEPYYNPSRWSLCTDESAASSSMSPSRSRSSFSYPNHPFASTQDVTAQDPFAKGHVQVVRHSAHSGEFPIGAYSQQQMYVSPTSKQRKRRTAPSPEAIAAPACPLPPPPHSGSRDKVLRIRVPPATAFSGPANDDWTLSLPKGVVIPRSPKTPTSPATPKSPATATYLQTLDENSRTRRSSLLSTTSNATSSPSHCPSAWHPSPPPSPPATHSTLPTLYAFPTPPSHISMPPTSLPPPPRPSRRSHSRPPRTADSTTSTESTDSTATITPTQRYRERERALAALNGSTSSLESCAPPRSPVLSIIRRREDLDWDGDGQSMWASEESEDGTYYTARSSFAATRSSSRASGGNAGSARQSTREGERERLVSQNFGSAWGCRVNVRVRADSGVQPLY